MNDKTCRKDPAVNPLLRSLSLLNPYISPICTDLCVLQVPHVILDVIKYILKAQMASTLANGPVCSSLFVQRACEMAYGAFGRSRNS